MLRRRRNRIPVILPPDEVVRVARDREVSPTEVGLPPGAVGEIWYAVERLYATGVHPAISLCIRHKGQVVIDRSIGHVSGNSPTDAPDTPKVLASPDTPFCIFSTSKAITAILVHLLDDKGILHIDDRVVDYLPEFGKHHKDRVTLRHVLTHRAGIPSIAGESPPEKILLDHDAIIGLLCEARPISLAGRQLAYHAVTGGFLLGEVVQRVTGKSLRQVLAEEILDPLGFSGLNYGWDPDRLDEVAVNAVTASPPPFPWNHVVTRALGVSFEEATRISNTREWCTSIVPSGNITGTANELSRFFQLLLDGGTQNGTRLFEERLVWRARQETSFLELDTTLLLPIRYGVGLMLGSEHLSLYGPGTPQAFGHHGFINCFGWADPERQISVGLLTSGKPFASGHLPRMLRVLHRISHGFPRTR